MSTCLQRWHHLAQRSLGSVVGWLLQFILHHLVWGLGWSWLVRNINFLFKFIFCILLARRGFRSLWALFISLVRCWTFSWLTFLILLGIFLTRFIQLFSVSLTIRWGLFLCKICSFLTLFLPGKWIDSLPCAQCELPSSILIC